MVSITATENEFIFDILGSHKILIAIRLEYQKKLSKAYSK
jgi:hypothetical protein